jgi:lysozyme
MNRDALASQLVIDEGLCLKPYDDATGKELKPGDVIKGKVTIGVGRNLSDVGISKSEAMMLLGADIDAACAELDKHLPWWRQMSDRRQQALANMCFNLGIDRLLGFKNTLAFMQAGDYESAANGMRNSLWAKQVGARADRLIEMMLKG